MSWKCGLVHEIYPRGIKFLDSPMDQYAFGGGELDGVCKKGNL